MPREITNNNGFLERISSVGPCHRYLHIPHHRLVSPHSCESRILLGHQVLVDFPFTRHRRHHCLPLYGEHHDSLPFGRLCIFLVLDHQGDIRAGRTSRKKAGFPRIQNELISSKDKGYKEFYPKVLHISIENATFAPAIQARMHRTCSSVG